MHLCTKKDSKQAERSINFLFFTPYLMHYEYEMK